MKMDIKHAKLFTHPIAHRGLHTDELPENSLEAFQNAISNGFPIEIDVRSIDDGTVIVFHDDSLGRMTGLDKYACTLSTNELKDLRLLGTNSIVPTLEQVLQLVNGSVPLLIEVKNNNKVGHLEKSVIEMLKSYKGEFAMQSFNPYCMEYFKIHAPDFLRGQLASMFTKAEMPFIKRMMLSHLHMNKVSSPHFISYNSAHLPNKYVTKTNLPVLAWTVKSQSEYDVVKDFCNNIIFERFLPLINE